jgi:hypothetical protein
MTEIKHVSQPTTKERKPYLKPRIETVELRPNETVLGVCKSQSLAANDYVGGPCNVETECKVDAFL